jgi:hypothetical protein
MSQTTTEMVFRLGADGRHHDGVPKFLDKRIGYGEVEDISCPQADVEIKPADDEQERGIHDFLIHKATSVSD